MYSHTYSIPNNNQYMYRNSSNYPTYTTTSDDDRFFLAPFLVGGLAGTALGYGIANNNQLNNNQCCGGGFYPVYPVPYYTYPNAYTNYSNHYYY